MENIQNQTLKKLAREYHVSVSAIKKACETGNCLICDSEVDNTSENKFVLNTLVFYRHKEC